MKSTKIAKALAYLKAHPAASPYQAAKHAGMSPTQLYARLALDKAMAEGICPACGRPAV